MESTIPVFDAASPEASDIQSFFVQVLVVSVVIFAIVTVWVAVAVIKGRKREGIPEQNHGNTKVEFFWLIGPSIVVLWLSAMSAQLVIMLNAFPESNEAPPGKADLVVTGHQWWWDVQYPDHNVIAANEIHIPAGKKLRVSVNSADVVHSFWVPRLARKIDAIPGRANYIWLEANEPGVYQGRCAEFCGDQHAWMEFRVYVHDEEDYAKWLAEQQKRPTLPEDEQQAIAGRDLFMAFTCSRCHTIEGTEADATIGPNLTHFASRKQIGGGVLENDRENLKRWLHAPEDVKPGSKMPNFKLSPEHLDQLVAYLETLK